MKIGDLVVSRVSIGVINGISVFSLGTVVRVDPLLIVGENGFWDDFLTQADVRVIGHATPGIEAKALSLLGK